MYKVPTNRLSHTILATYILGTYLYLDHADSNHGSFGSFGNSAAPGNSRLQTPSPQVSRGASDLRDMFFPSTCNCSRASLLLAAHAADPS